MTRTIAILGTGLIGASLGLALGTADPAQSPLGRCRIIGYDADKNQLRTARGRLAIDAEAHSAAEAVAEAEIVILATPVRSLPDVMQEIAPRLRYGALVTDVCSTKKIVMDWAKLYLPTSVNFVGGHPMAGRERSGADYAEIDLFRGSLYCLTSAATTQTAALDLATALVETVGAKPYFIDPYEHDIYVAGVSHLPFVVSSMLASVVTKSPSWNEMQTLAATGFRDVTRLASGDPIMHRDICLTNAEALTHWINQMVRGLLDIRDSLSEQTSHPDHVEQTLYDVFLQARAAREAWLTNPNVAQRPGEGRQMTTSELAPPGLKHMLFGDPEIIKERLKKKKDN